VKKAARRMCMVQKKSLQGNNNLVDSAQNKSEDRHTPYPHP